MKWLRISAWCYASGPYSVTKAVVLDGFKYSAWHGKSPLGVFPSADAARAACSEHLEAR